FTLSLHDALPILSGFDVPFVRNDPYLQKFDLLIRILVVLAVRYSGSGAHHLDVAMPDHGRCTHAVFVLQIALKRDRDDLHIVVRMRTKAHSSCNAVVVQYPQCTEMHTFGIKIVRKAKCMFGVEPTVVRIPSYT